MVAKPADAPVSYPFLWDTPQHDVVQWLGIAKNGGPLDIFTLSRNVGEVLGVFADFAIPEEPTLLNLGYSSSVKLTELVVLEDLLKTLWSPLWPATFPRSITVAAAKGAQLYQANCVSCHALIDRTDPNRKITAVMNDSGTDPGAAENFFTRTGPSGKLNGVNVNFVPFTAKIPRWPVPTRCLTNEVTGVILGGYKPAPPDELRQLSFRPAPAHGHHSRPWCARGPSTRGARSTESGRRPLTCITARCRTLDALLQPAAKRPTSFSIGVRTFDPVHVGVLDRTSPVFRVLTSTIRTARRFRAIPTPATNSAPT